jgi:serine/threonine protein kinase
MNVDVGTRLAQYELTALLGEGGMGRVFQARDTKLGRQVAVKVLPEAVADDADRVARFSREAMLLAALNHPRIAAIHGSAARRLRIGCNVVRFPWMTQSPSAPRSPTPSKRHTPRASFIGT